LKPISFVLITYNRPADMLELAQNIASLERAAELLEEVIIVNNASTEDYTPLKHFIAQTPQIPFRYMDAPDNLGVARGRNYALKQGKAPYIIMLDDDAVLENANALTAVLDAFDKTPPFGRPIGIVSFKVVYYDTGEMQQNGLPHKKYKKYYQQSFFPTYYYAGGAHAIKREILDQLGNYPEDFFYGMEEYDLSYRLLQAGYSIVYSDTIVMLHKESPLGRKPKAEKIRMMWVNKTKVAYRYLPKLYFYSTALMWSLFYLRQTGFNLSGFAKGWKTVFGINPRTEQRTPISSEALEYMRKVEARLWY
jgi:GT2 family glycosyltransferase